MSVQGPNQPQPKVSLEQLAKLADVNGDHVIQGQEIIIFDNAADAAGVKKSDSIEVGDYVVMRATTEDDKKGELDAETYKDSRADVGFAKESKNSRAEKRNIMIMCQQGVSNILRDFMDRVPAEQQSAFINYLDSQIEEQFQPGRYNTTEECQDAMRDLYNRVQNEFNTGAILNELKNFEAKTDQQHTETQEVISNQIDKFKQEVTVQLSELKADMGERFDKLDAGQLKILAQAKANGAGIAELKAKADELLDGQGKLGEQIDNRATDINLNIANEGNKTRAAIDKLSTQQAQQAELDAIRDAIEMTFVDELADGDTYRDGVRNWITDQMTGISGDPKISHDEKKQLLNALKDMIDTEMVISDADDLRAGYVGVGAVIGGTIGGGMGLVAGPGSAAVTGAYGAAVGGAIGNDLANKANLEGDVQRFQKAVQQAQTGELDPNWKWK